MYPVCAAPAHLRGLERKRGTVRLGFMRDVHRHISHNADANEVHIPKARFDELALRFTQASFGKITEDLKAASFPANAVRPEAL